jgi:hypothetical protein
MKSTTTLRPDAKGRIGIAAIARQLQERLGGRTISGYTAEVTNDGTIVLRPRVEVDAEEASTLVLAAADRDAFLQALSSPPAPNAALRAAARAHAHAVKRQ